MSNLAEAGDSSGEVKELNVVIDLGRVLSGVRSLFKDFLAPVGINVLSRIADWRLMITSEK